MNFCKYRVRTSALFAGALAIFLTGCVNSSSKNSSDTLSSVSLKDTNGYDIRTRVVYHPTSYITQMCYTKTADNLNKRTYNPCYSCHVKNRPPNFVLEDDSLQESYDFPELALKNPYSNDFKDFSEEVAKISDEDIITYVNTSNYFDKNGNIILAKRLRNLSPLWDSDKNSKWDGYIPDCYYNFDEDGFDHKPDGTPTGWVAFAYMPFLGTFWPTNGSFDDVLIRLDKPFRVLTKNGDFNKTVYKTNLAIVESLIKRKNIAIDPVNEKDFGVDLNKNGVLDVANTIVYDWDPNNGKYMSYVGYAKELLNKGELHLAAGLYPENTEFLHSVRYIKSDKDGEISISPRMKELRYARKTTWLTYATLLNKGLSEYKESSHDSPDKLEKFYGNFEKGLRNGIGWVYQGFIEDKNGNLRPQSYEETLNCMGCHSGIGAITDSTFAFPRKLDNNFRRGWYYTTQKDLRGIPENRYIDGTYEFTKYLEINPYGDEFRENEEVYNKFHLKNGDLNQTMIEKLHKDVSVLLYPSHKRALLLNKAYRVLVEQQQFYNGKAAHIKPMKNIYKEVEDGQPTYNTIYNPPPLKN